MNTQALRFLFLVVFAAVTASTVWAQTRYALVIGNAEYQRIEKLKNTKNDAEDISAALRGLGYQVELKNNLGHLQMVDAIEAFVTRLAANSANEGFFWYAGHAVQIRDENYLLPVDVTVDSESRVRAGSYSLNNLIEALEGAHNKVNVLILDSCRDNPLPASGRGTNTRGLAVVREVSDLFVMFSTAPGEKADDGAAGKRNSPFAEAFLKHIKSAEPLPIMAAHVTSETLSLTGQRQRPFYRGSIISEVYYSLNPTGTKPADVSPVDNKTTAQVHLEKGMTFFNRKDYDTAILEFNDAIQIDPKNEEAYYARGRMYHIKRDYDRAIADYTQSIRLDPNFVMAYSARGWLYFDKKDYDRAIADFNQSLRIDPNGIGDYGKRGLCYHIKGDYDRAIADYTQSIRLDPNNATAYFNRGGVYYDKKDYDRAIADYTQSIRLDPNNATAYFNRGGMYYDKKDYDRAIADFNQAIQIDPNFASAYYTRGDAYKAKGDQKKADADFAKAKELGYKP